MRSVSPQLAGLVAEGGGPDKLRAFPGEVGFQRRSVGPGWALVGDAGFFRDPITAHGISDALREAELLCRAVLADSPEALSAYQAARDTRVRGLMDVTDRIASFEWSLDEVRAEHLVLNRELNSLVDVVRALPAPEVTTSALLVPA